MYYRDYINEMQQDTLDEKVRNKLRVFKPEIFQGVRKRKNYFEGWYYKVITADQKHAIAFIGGVSYPKHSGDNHAFIQFFDSRTGQTGYFRFEAEDFCPSKDRLDVRIGNNRLQKSGIEVNLQKEDLRIQGKLEFHNIISYPSTLLEPGIMGPFSYVPFMECYHGVVNIHQSVSGYLWINGERIDFEDSYGYVEKDWGRSFPKSWVWMQSNHFKNEDVSFMFSIATIPFYVTEFTGFLSFLRIGKKFYRFATYAGAKIVYHKKNEDVLDVVIRDRNYELCLRAVSNEKSNLIAPMDGRMNRVIQESINSKIYLRLYDRKTGNLIFQGLGRHAGLEMMNFEELKM